MSIKFSTSSINFKEKIQETNFDSREIKPNNKFERQPDTDTVEIGNNKAKKIALGALGLGAVAAATDFIFAKGRHVKKIFGITEKELKFSSETKLEQTLSDFKEKGGKFVKNKLMNPDGTAFSGKLMSEGKGGKKYIYEYKDGILQKSESFQKSVASDISLGTKSYTYNSEGKISSITQESQVMDAEKIVKTKKFEYNSDGKIKSVICEDSNKIINEPFEKHFNYDTKGNLISIRTKTEKFVDGKVKTVEETKEVNVGKSNKNTGTSSGSDSSSRNYSYYYGSRNSGGSEGSASSRSRSTSGKRKASSPKTEAEKLQAELEKYNKLFAKAMKSSKNIMEIKAFIKDREVMFTANINVKTFLNLISKDIQKNMPQDKVEEVMPIVEKYIRDLTKDIKTEGSVKDFDNLWKEFEAKFDSVTSEKIEKELEDILKQYGYKPNRSGKTATSSRKRPASRTRGTSSTNTAKQKLQAELKKWEQKFAKVEKKSVNTIKITVFIKDGKVMFTQKVNTEVLTNKVLEDIPECIREESRPIVENYIKNLAKDVKVEGSTAEYNKLKKDFTSKIDTIFTDETAQKLIKILKKKFPEELKNWNPN